MEDHLKDSLSQLRLDYVDLFLIHWPVTDIESDVLTPPIEETWVAMEALVSKGLAKTIGVSNFGIKKLESMKSYAKIFPAVNQVELHPVWRNDPLLAACAEMNIHVTAYSPLGSPDSASMLKRDGPAVLEHEVITSIATETGRSAGQVLIRWAIQRGTSVIPKSVNPSRIEENFDMFTWDLSPDQMHRLSSIEPQRRMLAGDFWVKPGGPYRSMDELWE